MKIENYERHYIAGLIITIIILVSLSIVWITEPTRLEGQVEELHVESVLSGREIYNEQCVLCHGSTGQGEAGPVLNSKEFLKSASDRILFETISAGRPGTIMAAWAQGNGGPLTDEGLRNLVSFMRNWEENAPEVAGEEFTPDASRGMTLFSSSCFICHGTDGKGGAAPAINNRARLVNQDNDWYRDLISFGRPSQGMPIWGTVLSSNQIEDLVLLIDNWRQGESVAANTSVSEYLNSAVFELSQGQVSDTLFYLDRAEQIAFGPISDDFKKVLDSLENEQFGNALDQLTQMSSDWPIGSAEAGAVVYQESCSKCHGVEGEGGDGSRLDPNDFVQSNPNSGLLKFILSGRVGTAMGGFEDRLTEEQIANVIALMRLWQLTE